jgi:hypothetical protein
VTPKHRTKADQVQPCHLDAPAACTDLRTKGCVQAWRHKSACAQRSNKVDSSGNIQHYPRVMKGVQHPQEMEHSAMKQGWAEQEDGRWGMISSPAPKRHSMTQGDSSSCAAETAR